MHTRIATREHARSTAVRTALWLIGAVLLSGCASSARVKGTWQDGVSHKQSFTKVLVLGVSPDINRRCTFEAFMQTQLKSDSVQAIRSCDVVNRKNPLTLESIEQAVASVQADAVLATSLVSSAYGAKEGDSMDTRGTSMYKATDAGFATGYYGAYGVPVIYGEFETAPPIETVQGEVHVTSRFYETRDKTLLYTLDTQVRNIESRDAGFYDVAAAIAGQLRRAGLTR